MDLKRAPERAHDWESDVMGELAKYAQARHGIIGSLGSSPCAIHVAVFNEPYLTYILEGRKIVESRFSVNRCAPYRQVEEGDVVLIKRSSGPIVAACRVEYVWSYALSDESLEEIKRLFSSSLCAESSDFWKSRVKARYVTLMRVGGVIELDPIECRKRDRRGWVLLRRRSHSPVLLEAQ